MKKLSTVAILCGLLCACQKSFEWQAPEKGVPAREDVSIFSRPGVELGPYRRLRKMSRRLRGIDPSPEDLNRLREILAAPEAQQAESLNTFFAQMARSYASSEFATELMVYRTMELLRVKGPLSSPASRVNYPALLQEWKATTDNATVFLIRDVIEKNLPWNQLLTRQEYTGSREGSSDLFFYAPVLKELGITGKPDKITFPAGDQRAAGVLTTSMFRSRYVATPSNLNRRYAQAIYRIFLCEELTPVALPNTDLEAAYKKKLSALISFLQNLPASKPNDPQPHPSPGMGMEMNKLLGDPHATDPTCVSCHERLDPVAATFGTPGGQTFPEKAFPGAFVRRVFGEKIETPAAGIYELATILTNHPQYQDCQVKHFWDWFIGADAPQSAETHARWLTKFKEGTGVRDFIEWIAVQPEFRRDRTNDLEANLHDPTGFLQVEPILERCNGCHGFHGIDFTQRPWGGSRESDARWLIEFRRHLDPGAPVADAMPPNRDEWSATDLEKLRQWMNQATPWDDGGFP